MGCVRVRMFLLSPLSGKDLQVDVQFLSAVRSGLWGGALGSSGRDAAGFEMFCLQLNGSSFIEVGATAAIYREQSLFLSTNKQPWDLFFCSIQAEE